MKAHAISIITASIALCSAHTALAQESIPGTAVLLAYDSSPKDSAAHDDIAAALEALQEAEVSLKAARIEIDPLEDILAAANKDSQAAKSALQPSASKSTPRAQIAPSSPPKGAVQAEAAPKIIIVTKKEDKAAPKDVAKFASSKQALAAAKTVQNSAKISPAPPSGAVVEKSAQGAKKTPSLQEVAKKAPVSKAQTSPGSQQPAPLSAPHSLAMAYVSAIYQVNGVQLSQAASKGKSQPSIAQLYAYAADNKLLYEAQKPAIGDLVFFHNTFDRNRDGRWNDWHSLVGIVEEIDEDSTVTVLAYFNNAIERVHLNLKYPNVHKSKKGDIYNSQLRANEGAEIGISSKLFAGFANFLGDKSSVTVIDNWKPGMRVKP